MISSVLRPIDCLSHLYQINDLPTCSFTLLITFSHMPWAHKDEQSKVKGGLPFSLQNFESLLFYSDLADSQPGSMPKINSNSGLRCYHSSRQLLFQEVFVHLSTLELLNQSANWE